MTERTDGYSRHSEIQPLPEGFEMPTDSILLAEAKRDFYESEFIYSMGRNSDMPVDLASPQVKDTLIKARIEKVRKILANGDYDVQEIMDGVDIGLFSQDGKISLHSTEGLEGRFSVEEYQVENFVRSSANIIDENLELDKSRLRKVLVKRFSEAGKIAGEEGVSVEDVFGDQELYFQLVRRSYSPEEVLSETELTVRNIQKLFPQLIEHEARHATILANLDNSLVSMDDVDKKVTKAMNDKNSKTELQIILKNLEASLRKIALLTIERYWGRETAQLLS